YRDLRSMPRRRSSDPARRAPAHTLLNLALAAEQRRGPWVFEQMLRLDNGLDREYVSSVIVGQAQGRFYEPGATRSWFAGVSLRRSEEHTSELQSPENL